jgi:hypothetical protein
VRQPFGEPIQSGIIAHYCMCCGAAFLSAFSLQQRISAAYVTSVCLSANGTSDKGPVESFGKRIRMGPLFV